MIDRETMEYAAKAAGYKFLGVIIEEGKVIGALVKMGQRKVGWKPVVKDGDALRLVEKCQITVAHEPMRGGWSTGAVVNGEFCWAGFDEDCKLAIVRAAAEIGRTMP